MNERGVSTLVLAKIMSRPRVFDSSCTTRISDLQADIILMRTHGYAT